MFLAGRLDAAAAPLLERKLKQWGDEITELTLDFSQLTYISSMGLRVLLQAHKEITGKKRKLEIRNLSKPVREVFEMTGFINLMVREETLVIIRKDEPGCVQLSLIGQMNNTNVSKLEEELSHLRNLSRQHEEAVTVILDMEKLTSLSVPGCRLLKKVLDDTGWPDRKLSVKNASDEIRSTLREECLGELGN